MTRDFYPRYNTNEPAWQQYERQARQAEVAAVQSENEAKLCFSKSQYDEANDSFERSAEYWFRAADLYSKARGSAQSAIQSDNQTISDMGSSEREWKGRFGTGLPRQIKDAQTGIQRGILNNQPRLREDATRYANAETQAEANGRTASHMSKRALHTKLLMKFVFTEGAHDVTEQVNGIISENIKIITPEFIDYLDATIHEEINSPREDFRRMAQHLEKVSGMIDPICDNICIRDNPDVSDLMQRIQFVKGRDTKQFLSRNRERFGDVFIARFTAYISSLLDTSAKGNSVNSPTFIRLQALHRDIRIFTGEEKSSNWIFRLFDR